MKRFFKRKNAIRGDEIEDSIMTATQEEKAIIETPYERKRLEIVWYLIILILVVLAGRVVYLDVFKGEYYAGLSKGNRVRSIIIKAPRGEIKDKFGKVLVRNVPSLDIVLIPRDFPENSEERKVMTQKIAQILNLDQGNVEIILEVQNKDSLDPVLIKENISQEEALLISEKNNELPGILLDRTAIRQYENGAIFSAFIGYDGKITREELNKNKTNGYGMTDYIGKTGLEKSYEKELRGKHGAKQAEVDSLGNVKKNLGVINPEVGSGLILNIDEELQKKIYDSLSGALEGTG
ncbi:MAG: hypothetical protein CO139_04020, partial [Candidatus Moranbacteria bacterium CG_4_9_14_3_um_filter_36_9]